MNAELRAKITMLLREQLGMGPDVEITEDLKLSKDLGMDSLDIMEVVLVMEAEFEMEISDKDLEDLVSVRQFFEVVEKYVKGA